MIITSVRARIARDVPGALGWAREMASFVQKKTGNEVEALARTGATQDIVWLQRLPDLATLEKQQEEILSDPAYWAKVKEAEDKGFFDTPNVEFGIWRTI